LLRKVLRAQPARELLIVLSFSNQGAKDRPRIRLRQELSAIFEMIAQICSEIPKDRRVVIGCAK
jgi:hypothetical protein